MFNKFVATVITGTLALSATSAFAINDRVRLIKNCVGYDNNERPFQYLRVNDYYRIVKVGVFSNGQNGIKILTYNKRNRRYYKVNISTNCVESNQGIIVRY